jgi:hypothetical protein
LASKSTVQGTTEKEEVRRKIRREKGKGKRGKGKGRRNPVSHSTS